MLQKATVFCILLLLIVLYGCNENKDLNKISTQEQLVKIIEREIYQRELEDAEENIAILEQQDARSEEHTSELQSRSEIRCPLLLVKKMTERYRSNG